MKPHNHNSTTESCPACGLAPRQPLDLTAWGFEFLTKSLAPCSCGGNPVQIEGGSPKTFAIYCQSCQDTTPEYQCLPEAILKWNEKQIRQGFDARLLHPLNKA